VTRKKTKTKNPKTKNPHFNLAGIFSEISHIRGLVCVDNKKMATQAKMVFYCIFDASCFYETLNDELKTIHANTHLCYFFVGSTESSAKLMIQDKFNFLSTLGIFDFNQIEYSIVPYELDAS
jgi:hypothetical protein